MNYGYHILICGYVEICIIFSIFYNYNLYKTIVIAILFSFFRNLKCLNLSTNIYRVMKIVKMYKLFCSSNLYNFQF